MSNSKYVPIILETIGEGSASFEEVASACGQSKKIGNIRKALYRLLKEGKIEVNGYNDECKSFKYECILLKKVKSEFKIPPIC